MKQIPVSEEFFDSPEFLSLQQATGRDRIFWKISHGQEDDELYHQICCMENVDVSDRQGLTYLHMAALNHRTETIKLLLKKGADPNRCDNCGHVPVLFALGRKNSDNTKILKMFLEHGLDLDMMIRNETLRDHIRLFACDEYNELMRLNTQAD